LKVIFIRAEYVPLSCTFSGISWVTRFIDHCVKYVYTIVYLVCRTPALAIDFVLDRVS
jgi:hypothetical protein